MGRTHTDTLPARPHSRPGAISCRLGWAQAGVSLPGVRELGRCERVHATSGAWRASDYLCASIRRLTVCTPKDLCGRVTSAPRTKAGTDTTPSALDFSDCGWKATAICRCRGSLRRVYSWNSLTVRRGPDAVWKEFEPAPAVQGGLNGWTTSSAGLPLSRWGVSLVVRPAPSSRPLLPDP